MFSLTMITLMLTKISFSFSFFFFAASLGIAQKVLHIVSCVIWERFFKLYFNSTVLNNAFAASFYCGHVVWKHSQYPDRSSILALQCKMKLKVPYKCTYHPRIWKLFWNSQIEEKFDLMSKHWLVFFDQSSSLHSGQYLSHGVLQEFNWQD